MAERNGIKKVILPEDKNYLNAADVMKLLGVKQAKAYRVIKVLREELISSGNLLNEYPCGRIPKSYFYQRCGF